jgi:hypothetical protein
MDPKKALTSPWIRQEFVECLIGLADEDWLDQALEPNGSPSQALDRVLDFFDDSGVLDEPEALVGRVIEASEVVAVKQFAEVLDQVLDQGEPRSWKDASLAAGELLRVLNLRPPRTPMTSRPSRGGWRESP